MSLGDSPPPPDSGVPSWDQNLQRWLAPPEALPRRPLRQSAYLPSWLLIVIAVLLAVTYAFVLLAGRVAEPLRDPRSAVVVGAYLLIILAFGLNRAGRYPAAAGVVVGAAALCVWAVILISRHIPGAFFQVLPYASISVVLASLLLSPRATALVALGHGVAVLLVLPGVPEPDIGALVNTLAAAGFTSILLVATAAVRRRNLAQIEQQTSQLADDERRVRAILDNSPDAILLIDPRHPQGDWPILDCNEAAARMNGYERAELVGQSIDLLNATPARPGERHAYLERLRSEGAQQIQTVHRRKDGTEFPVEISSAVVDLAGRELVLGIARDITERQAAEAGRRRSEERFELVSYATNDAVWDWDLRTGQVWWNQGVHKLFGYAPADVGADVAWWEERVHPDDRARVTSSRRAAVEGGQEFWSREYRFRRAEGAYAHVFDRAYITRAEGGRPLRLLGAMLDITDRKRIEEALREAEEKYRTLVEQLPDVVYTAEAGASGRWHYVSPQIQTLLGFTPQEWMADSDLWLRQIHPDDRASVLAHEAADAAEGHALGYTSTIEYRLLSRDGRLVWVRDSATFFLGEPGLYHGLLSDVTDRKRVEGSLRESEKRYRALFDDSPVSLWEEDFSAVKQRLDALRDQGVVDFAAHLAEHPEIVSECAGLVMVTDVNKATLRMHRASQKSDLLGSLSQAVGPEMNDAFPRVLLNIAQGRKEFDWEGVNRTVTGERLDVSLRWSAVPGYEDTLAKVLVSIADITERKRIEAALRENEARYRVLFDDSPISLWEQDFSRVKQRLDSLRAEGVADLDAHLASHPEIVAECAALVRVIDVNKAGIKLFRAARKAELLRGLERLVGPGNYDDFRDQLARMARGQTEFETEAVNWTLTGEKIHVSLRWSVVPGFEASLAKVLVSISDITERLRVEQELTQANAHLSVWLGELEAHARDTALLNELVSVLQTCHDLEEAYGVVGQLAAALFPGDSGALFIVHPSRNLVETTAAWGAASVSASVFQPADCWALRRAQPHLVIDSRHGLSCRHLSPAPPAYICLPLFAQGELLGGLSLSTAADGLSDRKQQLAKTVADAVGLSLANLRLRESLRRQSIIDVLTGLFNRRYMEETLEREVRRCARARTALGIVMMDIDHFKDFNDAYGHAAGDAILAELGSYLRSHIRADDIACRYGGEEFTLILPDSSLDVTSRRATALLAGIRSLRVEYGGNVIGPVSVSLGVAAFPGHGADGAQVLHAADGALYAAKRQGRDRVVVAQIEPLAI